MAYVQGYGELEPLSRGDDGTISVRLPDGRVINAASQGSSEGGPTTYMLQNPFQQPSFIKQNGKWGYSDPLMGQFYGPMQDFLAPNALRALNLVPNAMAQQPITDPAHIFGFGTAGSPTTDLMLSLDKSFRGLEGYRSPYEIAQDYKKNFIGNDLGLNYTWMNAPGFTFKDILNRYLGQEAIAKTGFTYDRMNQGGSIDQFVNKLNEAGIADAFKRNEAGKKSGFGGMVKGWLQSPGSLMLVAAPGVLAHAFNPAVSGPMSALGNTVGSAFNQASGLLSKIPAPLRQASSGAAMSAIRGGNPLMGALTGGLSGLGGMASEALGFGPQLGSMLARQGFGAYNTSMARNAYEDRAQKLAMMRQSRFPQRRV